jgi:hypothetical protein
LGDRSCVFCRTLSCTAAVLNIQLAHCIFCCVQHSGHVRLLYCVLAALLSCPAAFYCCHAGGNTSLCWLADGALASPCNADCPALQPFIAALQRASSCCADWAQVVFTQLLLARFPLAAWHQYASTKYPGINEHTSGVCLVLMHALCWYCCAGDKYWVEALECTDLSAGFTELVFPYVLHPPS